tara:strand:- start:444 stop:1289 length:846 start_codon:yes stop_codon:yes gene_type:complete
MKKIKNILLYTHSKYLNNKEIIKLLKFFDKEKIILNTFLINKENKNVGDINKKDLIIVVGGDGLFISASKLAYKYSIPILGVNFGKIGFLVDVDKKEILQNIKELLNGRFIVDKRMLINGVITDQSSKIVSSISLNDIVIHNYGLLKMIEVKIYINDFLINSIRSDGIIISTPTGSTAYSMSNGCPIVSPNSNVMSIVPVSPHTYSDRPIIVNSNDKIKIVVEKKSIQNTLVTFDGHNNLTIPNPTSVEISKSNKFLKILHPEDYNYFKILSKKLKWGGRS